MITKIIDNPISIAQAFWSPYRRTAVAIENLINKSAADKDAAIMKDINQKITTPTAAADGKATAQPFDIGKFAGIFAAIGLALGTIGSALASLAKGMENFSWWQYVATFIGILLIISGPSMVMAWLKLRRRNIAPLLNANGWAINASSRINILFGETLTDTPKLPKLKLKDPYKKSIAAWKKWTISLIVIAVIAITLWLTNLLAWAGVNSPLPCYNKAKVECVAPAENAQPEAATAAAEESATADTAQPTE